MIICSDSPLIVGKIYRNEEILDGNLIPHKIPFLVIRKATLQEFVDDLATYNLKLNAVFPFHYEISMD